MNTVSYTHLDVYKRQDMVMMDYVTDFDEWNHAAFSCYRERILKTSRNFRWRGRVHESIIPTGNILYSPIQIEHRKIKPRSSFRNLHIYQQMIEEGETLEPRDLFYYGRELFYHKQYEYAICVLKKFLKEPDGWIEDVYKRQDKNRRRKPGCSY